jgi:hypothetical protein
MSWSRNVCFSRKSRSSVSQPRFMAMLVTCTSIYVTSESDCRSWEAVVLTVEVENFSAVKGRSGMRLLVLMMTKGIRFESMELIVWLRTRILSL